MSPRVKLPFGGVSATKSFAKQLTYYSRGGSQKVRSYHKPTGDPSAAQIAQRLVIKGRVEAWQALSDEDKASWNAEAKTLGDPWCGYSLYMSTAAAILAFTDLTDTFASYVDHGEKIIQIKDTEDGIDPGRTAAAARWAPDALPASPSDQDDHFNDDSLDPKWTEWDLGTPQLSISESVTFAIFTHAGENDGRLRGMYQTLPAGDFTIATKTSLIGTSESDCCTSLCLFEDATDVNGNICLLFNLQRALGSKYRDIYAQLWTDYETHSSNYAGGTIYPNITCYLRIRRSGTTLYYDYSSDGISWHNLYTHTQPFVPAHMGICTVNDHATRIVYGYFDFFRYIASNQIDPLGRMV